MRLLSNRVLISHIDMWKSASCVTHARKGAFGVPLTKETCYWRKSRRDESLTSSHQNGNNTKFNRHQCNLQKLPSAIKKALVVRLVWSDFPSTVVPPHHHKTQNSLNLESKQSRKAGNWNTFFFTPSHLRVVIILLPAERKVSMENNEVQEQKSLSCMPRGLP